MEPSEQLGGSKGRLPPPIISIGMKRFKDSLSGFIQSNKSLGDSTALSKAALETMLPEGQSAGLKNISADQVRQVQ
jgi:hypothetical protein